MWVSNVLLVVLYEQDDKQVPGHLLCFQPICTQDTLMLGTDYYLTESGIASLLAEGKTQRADCNYPPPLHILVKAPEIAEKPPESQFLCSGELPGAKP
ncbi:unnamed protein product [Brassica oleracea var. botrytis]